MSDKYFSRVERYKKIKSCPKVLAIAWKHYETNPADFINDWGMTFDPRVKPSNIPFILFPKQIELIDFLYDKYTGSQDGIIEKTRDCGATWVCSAFSVWLWIFHRDQSVGWGSRKAALVDTLGDLDSIFEKMRMFIRQLPDEFIPDGYIEKVHATSMKILNPSNGSSITGEGGDDIGRGGRKSMYFKDESAFYERPEKIEAALSQNSNVKIDISTPNGNGNPFCIKRFAGAIDVFTFNWRDDPRKDQAWYDEQVRKLSPTIVAQEIDINYDASVNNTLIDPVNVDRAFAVNPSDVDNESAPVILGVDPARYGDDATAIVCRQGRIVHFVEKHYKKSITELEGIVVQHVNNLPRPIAKIFIDEGGLGAGLVDNLLDRYDGRDLVKGFQFGAKSKRPDSKMFRTEIWMEMRDWLDTTVSLENKEGLRSDLCSLQYTINRDGQYLLESKDAAKKRGVKSPDVGDALALTFAEPVVISHNYDNYDESNAGRSAVTGY